MKQEHYSNWINNLPRDLGYLGKSQEESRKFLNEIGLPQKSMEEWRLTNLKRMEKLYDLPITNNQKKIFTDINQKQKDMT